MTSKRYTANDVSRSILMERATRSLEQLRKAALAIEEEFADALQKIAPELRESAYNLLHYLALRRHDVRDLQRELSRLGLSSLGRLEAHVMASLNVVLEALYLLRNRAVPDQLTQSPPIAFDTGHAVLAEHADAILGSCQAQRKVRIMVTMPGEAASTPKLIRDLLSGGMSLMRINCAHDDADVWGRIVQHLRQAEKKLKLPCKISFDLAGPKLRTGEIEAGEAVRKWRPQRNRLGQVVAPARLRIVPVGTDAEDDDAALPLPVEGSLLSKVKAGDLIALVDARARPRTLRVVAVSPAGCMCESENTSYVIPGTELVLRRKKRTVGRAVVGPLPPAAQAIHLHPGDLLDIINGTEPGREAVVDEKDRVVEPAKVACSLPEVFTSVRVGERMFFDDGKISAVVRAVTDERLRVEIVSAVGGSAKLRGEKGINLPDTDLRLPALTAKDREDLVFVAKHADMVALSFVQRPEDIEDLITELKRLGAAHLGIILKIETQQAFSRLPILLLAAMQHPHVAVMVARGDLGVEVGFERLSEVQEEILWFCEAAHIPVIWATQVLESLAKGGMPSRAEVTDAAMGSRAECVMLNKGPYILDALRFLRDVLMRMESHQEKKTSMLRRLSISEVHKPRKKAAAA